MRRNEKQASGGSPMPLDRGVWERRKGLSQRLKHAFISLLSAFQLDADGQNVRSI